MPGEISTVLNHCPPHTHTQAQTCTKIHPHQSYTAQNSPHRSIGAKDYIQKTLIKANASGQINIAHNLQLNLPEYKCAGQGTGVRRLGKRCSGTFPQGSAWAANGSRRGERGERHGDLYYSRNSISFQEKVCSIKGTALESKDLGQNPSPVTVFLSPHL